jgi:predicted nucleic acid-binding protein
MSAPLVIGGPRHGRFLFDASVWIAAESPAERYWAPARELVVDDVRRAAALDLTLYEVTNAFGARRGDTVAAAVACQSILRRCEGGLVRIEAEMVESIADIAIEHGLTSYDAAYVAVARRHDWTLVSTDIRDLVSRGLAITPDAAV